MKKHTLFLLIGILGVLIIGGFVMYQILKPEFDFGSRKSLQLILNPALNPLTMSIGQNEFSQFSTTGYFYYKLLPKTGNESLYSVSFRDISVFNHSYQITEDENGKPLKEDITINVNRTDTIICLEADFDNKQITTYKDNEEKEIDKNYTYSVPSILSFYKTDKLVKQTNLEKELVKASGISSSFEEGDINKFCYQANKEKDFYLKFGDNSVIIILEEEVVSTSLLTNVTAETGNADFTHLNISTTAPYDNLVSYWSFDGDAEDTTGTTAYDYMGNHNGVYVSATITNSTGCLDNYGDCAHFTSGTYPNIDAIRIGTGSTFSDTCVNGCSFSAWAYKAGEGTSANEAIIGRSDTSSDNEFFRLALSISHNLNFAIFKDGQTGCWSGGYAFTSKKWTYVVGVFDNSTGTGNSSLYVNGILIGSGTCSFSGIIEADWQDSEPTFIGAYDAVGNVPAKGAWNGSIDEVMIFNTSLTQAQVTAIYNNQSARFVGTGKQELNNQSYLNISSGNNRVNVTTVFDNNFESNLSLFLQYYESGSWISTSAQNLTSGQNSTFTIGSSSTNLTLNYTLIAGPNQTSTFYTPIVYDNIILDYYSTGAPPEDCWTDETWGTFIPNGCVYKIPSGEVG